MITEAAEAFHSTTGKSASMRIYESMRDRIVSMELPPGATISRAEMAKSYDVSQTPMREAMQRLESDGLIRIYPQSKTIVTRIDIKALKEAHFLRLAVESEVIRTLAENPDKTLISRAQTLVDMQNSLIGNLEEIALFNQFDEKFHRMLFAGAGQENLYTMLSEKSGHMARARRLDLPKSGKMQGIVEGHAAIIKGINAGNSDQALVALREHLAGTIAHVDALQLETPDYFR